MVRLRLAVALVCVLGLTSACSKGPEPLTVVHSAGTALRDAGGFHVRPIFRVDMPEGYAQSPFPSSGEGVVDIGRNLASIKFIGSDPVSGDPTSFTTDRIGDIVYTSGGVVAKGPDWCAKPISASDPAADDGGLAQLGQSFEVIPALLTGATQAQELGTAADPSVIRYSTKVDLRRAGLTAAADAVGDSLSVEVWVNSDGEPVRVSYAFDIAFEGAPAPAHVAVAITMSDFGTGVSVAAPPAAETGTFPKC